MKRIIFVLSFILFSVGFMLFSNGNGSLEAKKITITDAMLQNGKWVPEYEENGYNISFEKGNASYVKNFQGPGGSTWNGKYSVKNNIASLGKGKGSYGNDEKAAKCKFSVNNKSFYGTESLNCGKGQIYWNKKKLVRAGLKRKGGSTPVITMGLKTAVLKTNMKMRTGPSTSYKVNKCTIQGLGSRGYLEKGQELTILGRTVKKTNVGKHRDYWYYVHIDTGDDMSCDSTKIWLFGAFLKIK